MPKLPLLLYPLRRLERIVPVTAIITCGLLSTLSLHGIFFNPASGNWSDAGNWGGGVVPNNPGDWVTINQRSVTLDMDATIGYLDMDCYNVAGSLSTSTGKKITFDNNGSDSILYGDGWSFASTVSTGLVLKNDLIVDIGYTTTHQGPTLTLSGVIEESGGSYGLNITNGGDTYVISVLLSNSNTFTGGVTLDSGGLKIGHNNALGTGTFTVNGGAIYASGGTRTISNDMDVNGILTIGRGANLTFSGTTDFGSGVKSVNNYSYDYTTTFADDLTGSFGIDLTSVAGAGRTVYTSFTGNNNFTGGLILSESGGGSGRFYINAANTTFGGVTLDSGYLYLGHNSALGSDVLTINGGSILASGGNRTIANDITLNGNMVTRYGGNLTFTGDITPSAGSTHYIANINFGYTTTITDNLEGNFGLTVYGYKNGSDYALTRLSGNNNFTGGLTVDNTTGTATRVYLDSINTDFGGITIDGTTSLYTTVANALPNDNDVTLNNAYLLLQNTNQTIDALNGPGSVQLGTGTTNTLTLGNDNGDGEFTGIISETGNLVKTGTGTQILSGTSANTYTGTTTVNAGVLELAKSASTNAIPGNVVLSGGILRLGANEQIANTSTISFSGGEFNTNGYDETFTTLNLTADSVLRFGGGGDVITFTADTTSAGQLTIADWIGDPLNGGGGGGVDRLIIDAAAMDNIALTDIIFNGWGATAAIVDVGGGLYELVPDVSANTYTWDVDANGDWNDDDNWTDRAGNDWPDAADTVAIFTNGLSADRTVTLTTDRTIGTLSIQEDDDSYTITGNTLTFEQSSSPSQISVIGTGASAHEIASDVTMNNQLIIVQKNTSGTLEISGVIDDGGNDYDLLKSGLGDLILSGSNTYGGSTIINAGTLQISSDSNLGDVPGSADADSIDFNGGILQTTATFSLSSNRGITLDTSGGTLEVDDTTTLTYGGIIAGTGNLTKDGNGTLVLGGVSTYSGNTTVSDGTLQLSTGDDRLPTGTTVTIASGAILDLNDRDQQLDGIEGAGTVTNSAGTSLLTISTSDAHTFSGDLSDTGTLSLAKAGSGTQTLTGSSTIDGDVSVSAGTLKISGGGDLSGINTLSITDNGTLLLTGSGSTFTESGGTTVGDTAGTATLYIVDSATFTAGGGITAGANGGDGIISIDDATLDITGTGLSLGSATGTTGTLAITGSSATVDTPGAGTNTIGRVAGDSTASITIDDSATLTLDGTTNIYTGATIDLGSSGEGNIDGTSTLVFNGGTIKGNGTISNDLTLSGGTFSNDDGAEVLTLSGTIDGASDLTKAGDGTLSLSGTNTFTGDTNINAGILEIGADANLGDTSSALNMDGATLNTTATFTLNSNRAIDLSNTVTFQTDTSTTLTFNGVVSGTGSLTKEDAGTLVLGGTSANTYSGATTLSNGILQLNKTAGTNAIAGGTITINSSAELELAANNQIADASNMVLAGGTFDAGGYSETLTNLTLSADSVIDLGSGTSKLTFSAVNAWDEDMTLVVKNWTGGASDPSTDTDYIRFDNDPSAFFTATALSNITFQGFAGSTEIYDNGDGYYYLRIAPVIPEPSTCASVAALLGLAALHYQCRGNHSRNRFSATKHCENRDPHTVNHI